MQELDYKKFSDYFYMYAVPVLKKYEQERRVVNNLYNFLEIFSGLLFICAILLAIFGLQFAVSTPAGRMYSDYIGFAFVIPFLIGGLAKLIRKNFQKKIKEKVYGEIFEKFGLSYHNSLSEKASAEKNIRYICENSDILSRYDNINIDDIIKGEYNGLPFTIYDADIFYYTSGKHRKRVTVFRGVFLAAKINKNFKSETLIQMDTGSNPKKVGQKVQVKLEDIEFEKLFEVYSTDQIDARYILTTAFMERLKDFVTQKRYPIEVLFSKRTYMEENVFFFFDTRRDHFEINIKRSLMDKNTLFDVLWEVSRMLKVIEALKLDQNIGL